MVLFVLCTRRAKWQAAKGCREYRASPVMQGVSKCAQVGNGNRMCACNAHSVKSVASDVGRVCVVLLRHRRGVLAYSGTVKQEDDTVQSWCLCKNLQLNSKGASCICVGQCEELVVYVLNSRCRLYQCAAE